MSSEENSNCSLPREIKAGDKCEWQGRQRYGKRLEHGECDQAAEMIAYDRQRGIVGLFCQNHANMIIEQDSPEYTNYCQNCGCLEGVN